MENAGQNVQPLTFSPESRPRNGHGNQSASRRARSAALKNGHATDQSQPPGPVSLAVKRPERPGVDRALRQDHVLVVEYRPEDEKPEQLVRPPVDAEERPDLESAPAVVPADVREDRKAGSSSPAPRGCADRRTSARARSRSSRGPGSCAARRRTERSAGRTGRIRSADRAAAAGTRLAGIPGQFDRGEHLGVQRLEFPARGVVKSQAGAARPPGRASRGPARSAASCRVGWPV